MISLIANGHFTGLCLQRALWCVDIRHRMPVYLNTRLHCVYTGEVKKKTVIKNVCSFVATTKIQLINITNDFPPKALAFLGLYPEWHRHEFESSPAQIVSLVSKCRESIVAHMSTVIIAQRRYSRVAEAFPLCWVSWNVTALKWFRPERLFGKRRLGHALKFAWPRPYDGCHSWRVGGQGFVN